MLCCALRWIPSALLQPTRLTRSLCSCSAACPLLQVLPKLVTVGAFDGTHPSIACATSSDNLLLHSPHRRSGGGGSGGGELETRTLNLNRTISALAAGDLEQKPDNKRDILLIGSSTSLQGYDVESNSDVFFKEVADGVNALAFGSLASHPQPMAMVGGNCSLQGFNALGAEVFWTVTGDNVSALTFRDTKEGKQEVSQPPASISKRDSVGEPKSAADKLVRRDESSAHSRFAYCRALADLLLCSAVCAPRALDR